MRDVVFISLNFYKYPSIKGGGRELHLNKLGTGAWEKNERAYKSQVKDSRDPPIGLYSQHEAGKDSRSPRAVYATWIRGGALFMRMP